MGRRHADSREAPPPVVEAGRIRIRRPAPAATGPSALDRLLPEAATLSEAGRHEPPALIVEGPEGARRRRARDERDGVEVADPRPRLLYVGIAVFVALLVFAVLGLIEIRVSRRVPPERRARIASSAAASRNSQPMGRASSSKSKRGLWCGWSSPRAAFDEPTNTKQPGTLLEVDGHVLAAHGGLGTHDLVRAHDPLRRALRDLRDAGMVEDGRVALLHLHLRAALHGLRDPARHARDALRHGAAQGGDRRCGWSR